MKYTLEKYKQNLFVSNDYIYSYNTKVAYIDHLVRKSLNLAIGHKQPLNILIMLQMKWIMML